MKKTQQNASFEELTGQQWRAIALLVAGKRQTEIASELEIVAPTISRWKAEPAFAAALNLTVKESFDAVVGETRTAAIEALRVVRELMNSATDERTRLSAALQILRLHSIYDASAASLPTTAEAVAREQRKAENAKNAEDLFNFAFGG